MESRETATPSRHEALSGTIDKLRELPVTLIDKNIPTTPDNLVKYLGNSCFLVFCDADVRGITEQGKGKPVLGGYAWPNLNILNIDHHFEGDERFSRPISSTDLAMEFVAQYGPLPAEAAVIINHVDCDSVLSSAILRGVLPPLEVFGEAAIAADHTGEPHPVAELLQSFCSERDLELSLRNLELFMNGMPLEPKAQELVVERQQRRLDAVEIAKSAAFALDGRIAYMVTDHDADSALFTPLFLDAEYVVVFNPRNHGAEAIRYGKDGLKASIRLGLSAPDGCDVRKAPKSFDSNFGGRWNAGSNGRLGPMQMSPDEYIRRLVDAVERLT